MCNAVVLCVQVKRNCPEVEVVDSLIGLKVLSLKECFVPIYSLCL